MNKGRKTEKLVKGPLVLYEQMRRKVLELIEERGILPHDPVPSEGELADMFGVSRRTSKQALEMLASEGVVYRMPRRGTFLADPNAPFNIPGHDGVTSAKATFAIVVPEMDEYCGHVVSAAVRQAQQSNEELLIRITGGNQIEEEGILKELVESRRVSGIIFFPGDRKICGYEVLRLHLNRFPIVLVDRMFKEINIPSVCHDHVRGAYNIVSYLIAQGHAKIGFVSEPISGVVSREERYQGFLQAMQEHQLPFSPAWLFDEVQADPEEEGYTLPTDATRKLMKFIHSSGLTALFCANDHVAAEVLRLTGQLGIGVPDQLSIAGFTDLTFASMLKVPLTTVRKSPHELGRLAYDLLQQRMENPQSEPVQVRLETEVIVRDSVAPIQTFLV